MTHHDHLCFSTGSDFWVSYGEPQRSALDIIDELTLVLRLIHQRGPFAIYNTGSLASRFLVYVANRIQVPFVDLALDVVGHRRELGERAYRVQVSLTELEDIILRNTKRLSFPTVQSCAALHVGEQIHLPVIYDSGWAKPSNPHYDPAAKKLIGTPNWCLAEYESTFAIARALVQQNRPGIPLVYRYTPEFIHAQIETPLTRNNHDLSILHTGMERYVANYVPHVPGTLFANELADFTTRLNAAIKPSKPERMWLTPIYRLLPGFPDCAAYYGAII